MDLFHRILIFLSNRRQAVNYTADNIIEDQDYDASVVEIQDRFGVWDHQILHLTQNNWNITPRLLSWLPIQDKQQNSANGIKFEDHFETNLLETATSYRIDSETLGNLPLNQRITELVTRGLGAHLVQPEDDGYVIDLKYMSQYEVRNGFLPYGIKLFMDQDLNPLRMEFGYTVDLQSDAGYRLEQPHTVVEVDTELWQLAYNIFTASLITHVTIVDHALYTHFHISGNVSSLLFLNREFFPKDNLHQYFLPFIYRANEINDSALAILVNPGGIVNRLFGFTTQGMAKYASFALKNQKFFLFDPEAEIVHPRLTVLRDAQKIWKVIERFVKRLVETLTKEVPLSRMQHLIMGTKETLPELYNSSDDTVVNMIRLFTTHIFTCSFWHEHVGTMARYVLDTRVIKSKVAKINHSAVHECYQNAIQNAHLALLTSVVKMPRLTSNLWLSQPVKHHSIWQNFQNELNQLELETPHLAPNLLECSVSL